MKIYIFNQFCKLEKFCLQTPEWSACYNVLHNAQHHKIDVWLQWSYHHSQKYPLYQWVCSWDCWVLVKQDICCLPVWYRWCRMMKEVGKHLQDFVLHTFDTPRVVWAGTTCHHSSNCFSQLDNIPAGLTGHLKLKLYLQSQKSSWQYFQSSCSVCASWRTWHLLHEDCTTISFM